MAPARLDTSSLETLEDVIRACLEHYRPFLAGQARIHDLSLDEVEQLMRIECFQAWNRYDGSVDDVVAVVPRAVFISARREARRNQLMPVSEYRMDQFRNGELTGFEAAAIQASLRDYHQVSWLDADVAYDSDGSELRTASLMRGDLWPDLVVEGAKQLVERARIPLAEEEDLVVRLYWLDGPRSSTDRRVAETVTSVTGRECSKHRVTGWRQSALTKMRHELGVDCG